MSPLSHDPLSNVEVVTLAPNVPGPVAASRLRDLGARVTKIEPPSGDPLSLTARSWYEELHRGCTIEQLDLKPRMAGTRSKSGSGAPTSS